MLILKKIFLDIFLMILFFGFAALIAALVKMQNTDCFTCGANIGVTFWLAAVLALQPVLWVTGIKKRIRFVIWCAAMFLGGISYVALEIIGIKMFMSGSTSGLTIGSYSNIAFYIVAIVVSIIGIRQAKHKMNITLSSKW